MLPQTSSMSRSTDRGAGTSPPAAGTPQAATWPLLRNATNADSLPTRETTSSSSAMADGIGKMPLLASPQHERRPSLCSAAETKAVVHICFMDVRDWIGSGIAPPDSCSPQAVTSPRSRRATRVRASFPALIFCGINMTVCLPRLTHKRFQG
ncbi:hypothetical protein D3C76_1405260 [compost metagenome]